MDLGVFVGVTAAFYVAASLPTRAVEGGFFVEAQLAGHPTFFLRDCVPHPRRLLVCFPPAESSQTTVSDPRSARLRKKSKKHPYS